MYSDNFGVVVTGGTRGIGRQIVRSFAQAGARIAIIYRNNETDALSLAAEVHEISGGEMLHFKCPVQAVGDISKVMKAIGEKLGGINCLVNCAGVMKVGMFGGMKHSDWKEMIDTNLHGLYSCTKSALPYLLKSKQAMVINISSFMAFQPAGPGQAVYCATKAGIVGFTRALAKEVGSVGIRVNAVLPGLVETEMIKPLGDKIQKTILAHTIQKKHVHAGDIGALAVFLASPEASSITGQSLVLDSGGVHFQF